ncbi:MAG: hypothetical protein IPF83_09825 [Rhodanobacteraceae bacterium]|nr:hypothetical protein [Rhodanobacteraceae bacterium]
MPMKNFSKFLAVLACLLFLFTGLARANDIDYVHVELNYRLNGEEMFKTTAIAKPGTEGILTLRHETKRPQYQLRYVVSDIGVSRKGTPVASLSVQVFEGEDGAWVLRGDPRVGIALGKPASLGGPVEFNDRGIGNYALEATITPMTLDEVEKATGSRDPQAKVCAIGSLKPSLTDDGGESAELASSKMRKDCCSSACAAGSIWYGYYLNCCGVVWCCDCGTCCEPD